MKRRVPTCSDTKEALDSKRKRLENLASRRLSSSEMNSEKKESKNQKTVEQHVGMRFTVGSLGKIKKRLARKSGRGGSKKNTSSSKNLFSLANENNLTVKTRPKKNLSKGNKRQSKKLSRKEPSNKKRFKQQMKSKDKSRISRQILTHMFNGQHSQPVLVSESTRLRDLTRKGPRAISQEKQHYHAFKNKKSMGSLRKPKKKRESMKAKDLFFNKSRSPSKMSIFSKREFEKISSGQFLRSFSKKRQVTSKNRQNSPSLGVRSLRKESQLSKLLKRELRNRRSVREIKRNFSVKDKLVQKKSRALKASESHGVLHKKGYIPRKLENTKKTLGRKSLKQLQTHISNINLQNRNNYYVCGTFKEERKKKKSKKKSSKKKFKNPSERSTKTKNISQRRKHINNRALSSNPSELRSKLGVPNNLRKNFSNFKALKDGSNVGFGSGKNTLCKSSSKDQYLRTQKSIRKMNQTGNSSRPITWVSGSIKRPMVFSKRNNIKISRRKYSKPSLKNKHLQLPLGMSKKLSNDLFPKVSNVSRYKTVSYNSMHINMASKDRADNFPATECYGEKGSFLEQSVFKESSVMVDPFSRKTSKPSLLAGKRVSFVSKKMSKYSKTGKKSTNNRSGKSVRKGIKSRPILKELVAQLKGNDFLQLEILKSLGCKLKPTTKKRKNLNQKRSISRRQSIGHKKKKQSASKNGKKRGTSRSKLEHLRSLNRLITSDKQQVSKLKSELEKSSHKASSKNLNPKSFPTSKTLFESQYNPSHLRIDSTSIPMANFFPGKRMVPITNQSKRTTKVGVLSEPFSLQNNKLMPFRNKSSAKGVSTKNPFGTGLLKLGNKPFSKRRKPNTVFQLADNPSKNIYISDLNSKENHPMKIKSSKKNKKKNLKLQTSNISRTKSSSNLKVLKTVTLKTRKKSSNKKKRVMRDEDIKHHMNIILANDLNLERKKHPKKKNKERYLNNKR